jgi:hypothetical protein
MINNGNDKLEERDGIFAKLKKLFSDEVVVRRVGGKQIKVADVEHSQYGTSRNSLRDRFNRLHSTSYGLHSRDMAMAYQSARLEIFRDMDTMDMDPIINSALDIYADSCLTPNEYGKVLTISSDDENIKQVLDNLFYDVLNVEFNMWSWIRNLCKYGDFYLLMDISPEYGVYSIHPLSPYEVTRVEGTDPDNKAYVKFQHDGARGGQEYENFEVAHFRLISDSNFLPYGRSMLEGARRVWKQLNLMEDAMLIHRIVRAPEKRIFKIDVGNTDPTLIDGLMEKVINKMKKVPYIDERTGDYNLRYNLQSMMEDYFLPVRGSDSGTSIDTLGGMEFTGTEDIEYLRNKMMAALKIPKAFLGYDETVGGKSTLNMEDIRFSMTINRLQKIICSELNKIALLHLYVQGYRDASLLNFKIELTNSSAVLEQEKIAFLQDKVNLAKDMVEAKLFSLDYIYKEVFKLSTSQIREIKNGIVSDRKILWRYTQIEEEGNDPAFSKQSVDSEGSPTDVPDSMKDSEEPDVGGEPSSGSGGGPDAPDFPSEDGPLKEAKRVKTKGRVIPDQTGIKDSSDYPFGENPLGKKEDEDSRTDPMRQAHRGGILSIRETELARMNEAINKKFGKKPIILSESIYTPMEKSKKSMLDETQIIQDE